jgi:hypothetical protein
MGLAIVLVAVLMPSKVSSTSTGSSGTTSSQQASAGGQTATAQDGNAAAGVTGSADATGPAGSAPTASASGSGSARTGAAASGAPVGGGSTAASGVARNGVKCGPGVRQVTWLAYAPPCKPAFSGNNGGATARGVTDKTITVVLRRQSDGDALFHYDALASDIQTYIDLFNKNYELYGRHVELKVFNGQASFAAEVAYQGQAQTQADAQTAYDMGAFADIYLELTQWSSALVEKKIIASSMTFPSQKRLDTTSPFGYSGFVWHTADNWGHAAAAVACNRLKGMPAIFAGDAVFKQAPRTFGLVTSNDPDWSQGPAVFEKDSTAQCGLKVAQKSTYSVDLSTEAGQAVQIVSQMKAANVTTVITGADALMASLILQAADQQRYYPEWVLWEQGNSFHMYPADNDKYAIQIGVRGQQRSMQSMEAFKAYQTAKPGGTPASVQASSSGPIDLDQTFYPVASFFNALQAAGPNLTPATFQQGWFSLADTTGPYGLWHYGPRSQNVLGDFAISLWDPNKTNALDGKAGDFALCNGATRYKFTELNLIGTGQLACKANG